MNHFVYYMKNRSIIISIVLVLVLALLWYLNSESNNYNQSEKFQVGLVYLVKHPAIDQAIEGFKEELKNDTVFNIEYANAFGEVKNVNTIVNGFKQKDLDLIVALTTPCAQISEQMVDNIPIVFVGVSDPVEAGLVKDLNNGFENVTGTTSKDPNYETLELAKKLFPEMKRVGVLYSSSEANSVSILENIDNKIAANSLDVEIIKKSVTNTIEILPALNSMINDLDAIFLINDNTIISSLDLMLNTASDNEIPIFASDIESVNKGALFTYGLNYKDEGVAAAQIMKRILVENKKPSEIPIYINSKYYLHVNKSLLNYDIDSNIIDKAKVVGE